MHIGGIVKGGGKVAHAHHEDEGQHEKDGGKPLFHFTGHDKQAPLETGATNGLTQDKHQVAFVYGHQCGGPQGTVILLFAHQHGHHSQEHQHEPRGLDREKGYVQGCIVANAHGVQDLPQGLINAG